MTSPLIDDSGTCTLFKTNCINETELVTCYDCQNKYHGVCSEDSQYCTKTFLSSFKKSKSVNFVSVCNTSLTRKENNQATSINEQLSSIT